MRFDSPEWFLLIPMLLVAGWFWRGLKFWKILRAMCLGLVVLILSEPQIRKFGDGLDLWVLVDRSDSAKDLLEPRLGELEAILENSKGRRDRVHYIDFADEAVVRGAQMRSGAAGTNYAGATTLTRLYGAIQHALGQRAEHRATRMLVLSDGYSTEPLIGMGQRLVDEGVPLDFRLVGEVAGIDYRLATLQAPRRVQMSEAFLVEVVVLGNEDGMIQLELLRNGISMGLREVEVSHGVGRLRFMDRLNVAGAFEYQVRLRAEKDGYPGNNAAAQWVEVQGGPRVVLITKYVDDPLTKVLGAQGFTVDVSSPEAMDLGKLSGAKVVVLNNVPSYEMKPEVLKAIDFFVNGQGGGLLMTGGKRSFAAGGWYGSTIESLLPVSMELKQEHRKLAMALAIVMDRSGSMSMTAPGTSVQKMHLANEGTARAIELLGDSDMATIFAVDSTAHKVAPLMSVGKNRGSLQNLARRVESMGGGIYVYEGLQAAWNELKKAPVGQRHVILFSDAADSEEPGEYVKLLEEMTANKTSVSVIGLGSDKDVDAMLLKDIATKGNGRIFFNADAGELPALFAQETVAVARSAFIDEPVAVKGLPGWMEMAGGTMQWLPHVNGYNLSYLRPGASQAAVSGDEYAAPLVAFWQRGAGRVAAVSFPLGGEFSAMARSWDGYGGFVQSLTRWLMGEQLPPGMGLRTELKGERLFVDLYFDESWNQRVMESSPKLVIAKGESGETQEVIWERLEPGHFRAGMSLVGSGYIRGAVQVGGVAFPFGPVNAVTNPEWTFEKKSIEELRDVSKRSGGEERVDLSDVWQAPRPPTWTGVQQWLLIGLLVALLLEAWQTRAGWRLGRQTSRTSSGNTQSPV